MAELKRLEARLTEGQLAKLNSIARAMGLNCTDMLRLLMANAFVDAEGVREGTTVVLDTASMAGILRQTRAIGINLNQATHALSRIARAVGGPLQDRTAALLQGLLGNGFMHDTQTSYRLPIRVLVQEKTQIWCTLGAKVAPPWCKKEKGQRA